MKSSTKKFTTLFTAVLMALTCLFAAPVAAEGIYTANTEASENGILLFVDGEGMIMGPGPREFAAGDTVTVRSQPTDGAHAPDTIYIDGEAVSTTGQYTFTMPEHDITISATYKVYEAPECAHEHLTHVPMDPPTCDQSGIQEHWVCDDCGKLFSDEAGTNAIETPELIDPLGHDWDEWYVAKEATTEETGLERRVCKRDNTHVEEREIEKLPSGETGGNESRGSGNGEASNPGIPGNTGPSEPEVQVKKQEPKYNGERYRVLDTSVKGPRPSAKLLGTKTLAKAVRKLKVHARIKPGRAIRPVQPKPTPVER